jgi:hypothetical protein
MAAGTLASAPIQKHSSALLHVQLTYLALKRWSKNQNKQRKQLSNTCIFLKERARKERGKRGRPSGVYASSCHIKAQKNERKEPLEGHYNIGPLRRSPHLARRLRLHLSSKGSTNWLGSLNEQAVFFVFHFT